MLKKALNISNKIVLPLGNLMRSRKAKALAKSKNLPHADAVIAMAFAQKKDGSLNLPTQSIIETAAQLLINGKSDSLICFGSGQKNNITEAQAMAMKAKQLGIKDNLISKVEKPEESLQAASFKEDLAVKELDMVLLGQELNRLNIETSYLVAHPLHLGRAYMLCKKKFPGVTFYPVEAERLYDWESNQIRCRAEIFFIPWNILAFAEHFIKGKI